MCWRNAAAVMWWVFPTVYCQITGTQYIARPADETMTSMEMLRTASLVECVAQCNPRNYCTVLHFDAATNTCHILDRNSISWDNPNKRIYVVDNGTPRKITFLLA